jgi:energy-coupling factor transporter ATP-binding protein EcfA2
MKLIIDPSERWLILGKTGSGKTQFAKYLLRTISQKMPVVIIDPNELWLGKGHGGRASDWASRKELGTIDKPHLINSFNPKWRVQCLQPDVDGSEEDPRLERLCYDLLKRGNVFIYFDESEGIATAQRVPAYIRRVWKTGRAHGLGAWVSTQAPTGIPKIFKSQAEHFVTFKVGIEDTEFVANMLHSVEEDVEGLGKYEWLYYNTSMDIAEWNSPIPFTGKATYATR